MELEKAKAKGLAGDKARELARPLARARAKAKAVVTVKVQERATGNTPSLAACETYPTVSTLSCKTIMILFFTHCSRLLCVLVLPLHCLQNSWEDEPERLSLLLSQLVLALRQCLPAPRLRQVKERHQRRLSGRLLLRLMLHWLRHVSDQQRDRALNWRWWPKLNTLNTKVGLFILEHDEAGRVKRRKNLGQGRSCLFKTDKSANVVLPHNQQKSWKEQIASSLLC